MAVTQYRPATDPLGPLSDEFVFRPGPRNARRRELLRAPEADVVETDGGIRVVMDAPGMTPDDMEISLEDNLLTVSGERRPEWRESERERLDWHLSERRYGKFSRSFVLPRDVEPDGVRAHLENGVLTVRIPKSEKTRRRRIEVRPGGPSREVDPAGDG